MQTYVCILCLFVRFGITDGAQLAWRFDVLWWELRLTGLPSLPTAQPFIKSMPPLNTTLPCGAGPCYSLPSLLVWGGKHRETDKLEPPSCLLLWSDNSTVSNMKKNKILKQEPLHLNFTFFGQLYFFLSRHIALTVKIIVFGLDWLSMGDTAKWFWRLCTHPQTGS